MYGTLNAVCMYVVLNIHTSNKFKGHVLTIDRKKL